MDKRLLLALILFVVFGGIYLYVLYSDKNETVESLCLKGGGEMTYGSIYVDGNCDLLFEQENFDDSLWGAARTQSETYCKCKPNFCWSGEKCINYIDYKNNK